jgi:hypothetical protein
MGHSVRVKRLNGVDAMLLYSETPNLHTHTLKIAVVDGAQYDGVFTFDVFRRTLSRRLHLLEPLRYKLVDIPWRLHHPTGDATAETTQVGSETLVAFTKHWVRSPYP